MQNVLYLEDITKTGPLIDYNTKNSSFTRMSILLRRMGIKNYYFFLVLFDRSLQGVDPHSSNLTTDQKLRIMYECKRNFWYWLREVVRVPVIGQEGGVPFGLHRGNLALYWSVLNDVDIGLIQPRQTGKTIGVAVLTDYFYNIWATGLDIGMFTKDTTLVQDNVSRLKGIRDGLPKWMVSKSTEDSERKEGLYYAALKNAYKTFTSANDEISAYKLGRGCTMGVVHFDEIAFMNYNWIIVPTAANSMLAASRNARAAGMVSPIIFTTTAGNPDTRAGAFALSIFQSAMQFSEKLYDLQNRNELLEVIKKSSTRVAPMLYLEFSYRQLGFTDEWFKENASRSGASQDDINRDFLNIWQSSSDSAILEEEIRRKLVQSRREPNYTEIIDDFVIRWYIPEDEVKKAASIPMVMGSDSSENIGKDFTTFTLVKVSDLSVLATFRCNNSNTMEIARFIMNVLTKYPNTTFIPERQNTGIVITDFVIEELQKKGINPYTRVYNDVVQNLQDKKYQDVNIYDYNNIPATIRGMFGYRTGGGSSGTSRNLLYKNVMRKALEINASRIYDRTLVTELTNLTEKGGRIDHSNGKHDDQVISLLLACYLIFYGRNLNKYNIDNSDVLSNISTGNDKLVSKTDRQQQLNIKQRIAELEAKLSDRSLPIALQRRYDRELINLKSVYNDKLNVATPLAVEQINYQEKQMNTNGNSLERLKSFTARYLRT